MAASISQQVKKARSLYRQGKERYALADYATALQLFKRSIRIQEVNLGKYHAETIRSYWRMGRAACKEQERVQALRAFQRAARMAGPTFKENSYQKLLTDIEQCWQAAHPEDGDSLKMMIKVFSFEKEGDVAFKRNQYVKAIEAYCKALKLQDSLLGQDSLDGADIRCKLALCFLKTSATPQARRALQMAYDCFVGQVGKDHPATLGAVAKMKTIAVS
jgi:tetratricopeptide (TPR) repeat protein